MTTIRRMAEAEVPILDHDFPGLPIAWFSIDETDIAALTADEECSTEWWYSFFGRKGKTFEHVFSGKVPDKTVDRDGVFLRRLLPDGGFTHAGFVRTLRGIHIDELTERRESLLSQLRIVEERIAELARESGNGGE